MCYAKFCELFFLDNWFASFANFKVPRFVYTGYIFILKSCGYSVLNNMAISVDMCQQEADRRLLPNKSIRTYQVTDNLPISANSFCFCVTKLTHYLCSLIEVREYFLIIILLYFLYINLIWWFETLKTKYFVYTIYTQNT